MRTFYLCFEFFLPLMKVSINKCELIFQKTGKTCLMAAAASGSVKVVRAILERGADVNALDIKHNHAAHYAAIGGSLAVLACMSGHGALFDQTNSEGNTPIHNDAMNGHGMCCKFLAQRGKGKSE